MAKRRESAAAETESKKLKQVLSVKSGAAKKGAGKKDAARRSNGMTEEPEELNRKVKPKPRSSTKRAACNTSSATSTTTVKTSKYFQSPLKEEVVDSEDDFDMVTAAASVVTTSIKNTEKEEEMDSEEDEDEWEEVEELADPACPVELSEPPLCSQPVEIEIETPEVRKKQKRQAELETYLRRMMNRYKKDQLIDTHKVHLMCLIASGMFHNRLCSEPDLLAVTLSLLPSHFGMVTQERFDQNHISGLLKWFRATFTLNPDLPFEERPDPRALLERRLASLSVRNHQEMTHLFLLVLRSLQLFCRLVLSLQPVPLKVPSAKGKSAKTAAGAPGKSSGGQGASKTSSPEPKVSPGTKRPAGGDNTKGKGGRKKARRKGDEEEEGEEKGIISAGQRPKNLKRRSVASKISYKEESDSGGEKNEAVSDEDFQVTREEDSVKSESRTKSTMKKERRESKGKVSASKNTTAPKRRSDAGGKQVKEEDQEWKEEEEEEEEYDEEVDGMTSSGTKRMSEKKGRPGTDEWLEVYLEKTSSWVCVDVEHGIGMPHLCSKNATAPVTYVVSIDGDGFLKDLGRKYDPTWMTSSRKRRVDDDWWEETLEPFLGPEDERDIKEDKELQNKLLNKPLPTSVAEFKNHPLYALKRHLLKYEAIYPSTATVLGYCRGEPVYSRDCVHTLHSRDTWLKEARTVRLGEEPYKMVRSFSNRSRKSRIMSEMKDDNDLPLFGEWQTEEYQPPIAVDGKIPRNEYGNVYLFKPCMLPVGCVHLRLPSLHRVARKLNLDAVPAVTGFDFHGGYSHAVTDGYIVCEEHEEILRAAWIEEEGIKKQKEKEKIEKRAISNWTLLVKGLLIRERLKQRYGKKNQGLGSLTHTEETGGLSSDEEVVEDGGPGDKTASETLAMSWPQNRQAEKDRESNSRLNRKTTTKREKKGQQKHLFPFEKA